MSETRVGVRRLKARLSEYLSQVKAGHTIIVTEHNRPIGKMVPIDLPLDDRVQSMVESGQVSWSGNRILPRQPVVANLSSRQVSDILVEMRE